MHKSGPIIFISIFIAFAFLLHIYTFQGIKLLTADFENKWVKRAIYLLYWTVNVLVPILVVVGMSHYQTTRTMNFTARLGVNTFFTLLITEMVFITFLFSEDIYRLVYGLVAWINSIIHHSNTATSFIPSRRKFITQLGLVVASIPFVSFVYGGTKGKYNYKVHRYIINFPDLPEAFDGFKIVQLSDIHAGSFSDREAVSHGIDLVNEQKPDLFVFTGDFVNDLASELEPWKDLFGKIKAPHGQFSILGNHDYGDYVQWENEQAKQNNILQLIQHQKDMGYRMLMDENVSIEKNGQKISLIGIQNWGHRFVQHGDLEKALRGVPDDAFKILLSHDPSHFEHQVKEHPKHIHLTLSGHTHGMQMGFEFKHFRWSPSKWAYQHWAGLYRINQRYLNVNRGFGFIGFNGRVGIWPEITLIELKKA